MEYPTEVTLIEVGPRDGLQNEATFIPTADKIHFINLLSETGSKHIEVTGFVSPQLIPQLRDASEVFSAIQKKPTIDYMALIPNIQGFETALNAGVQSIALFTAASESFNQHNIHCSIAESFNRFEPVVARAKQLKIPVRAYISCALGCPYEGKITPLQVAKITESLLAFDVDEISLADTTGVGTAKQTEALLNTLQPLTKNTLLGMHFHDTYGQALANILIALNKGITRFDTSVAGLGGCPYAPGASGNVATEDVLYFLQGLGVKTGIDLEKMLQAGEFICKKMNRKNQSKAANALLGKTCS